MTLDLQNPCRITFLNRWTDENHLWGLSFESDTLQLRKDFFSCCDGAGIHVNPQNFSEATLCGLTRRWNFVNEILMMLKDFKSFDDILTRPHALLVQTDKTFHESLRVFMEQMLDGILRSSKGRVVGKALSSRFGSHLNRGIGVIALVLGWHFNVLPLLMDAESSQLPVGKWEDLMKRHANARRVLILYNLGELWHPNRLEMVEATISFASERSIPIWLIEKYNQDQRAETQNADDPQTRLKEKQSFKAAINQRLKKAKAKPLTQYLSLHAQSRLSEICFYNRESAKPVHIPDQV